MTPKQMHRSAMQYAQEALVARDSGDQVTAMNLFVRAFELEKNAALSFKDQYDHEPTRGILFRSAATLAMDCKELREAERMVAMGLAGNPREDIAEELRDLYENINLSRHLLLKGVELSEDEIQMSLSGKAVGFGITPSYEINNRLNKFEKLAYRTAERKLGIQFRTSGQVDKKVKDGFQPFYSVPRAASFAITIRLGQPESAQLSLFQIDRIVTPGSVLDEVITGMRLINEGKEKELKKIINDDMYYQNFLSLTKGLAPDGDNVLQVGFTRISNGSKEYFGFRKKSKFIHTDISTSEYSQKIIIGVLKAADGTKNKIKIVENKTEKQHIVTVPEGLNDIVSEYWNSQVIATISKKSGRFELDEIEAKN